jgi:hypothetical protein
MIEKLAQAGERGFSRSPSFTVFTTKYKVSVGDPAERTIHSPYFISTLYILCGANTDKPTVSHFFPQRNCDFIRRKFELDTTLIQSNCHRLAIYDYNVEEQIHCRICRIVVNFARLWFRHRLKMESDLQSLFGLLCTLQLNSLAETPQLPLSPRIWAHTRGRYWPAKISS